MDMIDQVKNQKDRNSKLNGNKNAVESKGSRITSKYRKSFVKRIKSLRNKKNMMR